jgi:large subunit ribosomal protein L15
VADTKKIGLDTLSPPKGSHRARKRIGRGPGSGQGKTAGKGHKGSKARAGHGGPGGGKPHFEGGQMPITRRLPKRGMTNPFREEHQIVTLESLNRWPEGSEVTQEALVEAGWVRPTKGPAKVLATGKLSRAVTVRGVKVSESAREQILAAGGRVEA